MSVYRRNVCLHELSGVGTILINRRLIEYTATAISVAALFCFPINDIKKVMGKKPKLE